MTNEVLIYNKSARKAPKKIITSVILRTLDFLRLKRPAELAVLIVTPKEIKRLNKVWRCKNEMPDELSFGLNSRQTPKFAKKQNKMLELGEIVINSRKITDKNHLVRILTHGLLHLCGYHHEKSAVEAKKTEKLEKKLLKILLN